jgi:hypothetical protein
VPALAVEHDHAGGGGQRIHRVAQLQHHLLAQGIALSGRASVMRVIAS